MWRPGSCDWTRPQPVGVQIIGGAGVPLLVQAGCAALGALVSMALHETAEKFFPRGGAHANAATEVAR